MVITVFSFFFPVILSIKRNKSYIHLCCGSNQKYEFLTNRMKIKIFGHIRDVFSFFMDSFEYIYVIFVLFLHMNSMEYVNFL